MKRFKVNSLTSKTFLSMAAITLLVLITVAIILFFGFRNEMVDSYRQLVHTSIANTDVIFAQYINNTKNLAAEWYGSSGGISSRLNDDYDYMKEMPFVLSTRSTVSNIPYIQSVQFINSDRQVALKIGGSAAYTEDIDNMIVEKLSSSTSVEPIAWTVDNRFSGREAIHLLTVYILEMPVNTNSFTGAMAVNIDTYQLSKNLFAELENDDTKIFILNEDGIVIGQSSMEYLGENLWEHEWYQNILLGSYLFEAEFEDTLWEFSGIKSEQNGFYIVALSEYVNRTRVANSIINSLLLVIFLASAAAVIISFLTSRRIFQPFTRMVTELRESPLLLKSTDAEQDEVRFLDSLYKQASSQISVLRRNRENDFIVKNLLLGSRSEDIQALLLSNNIVSEDRAYYFLNLYIDAPDDKKRTMQEYDMMRNMVNGIYASVLEELCYHTYFEMGLRSMLFILVQKEELPMEDGAFVSALDRIRELACRMSKGKVFVVVSMQKIHGNEDCVTLFQSTEQTMKTRRLLDMEKTVFLPGGAKPSVKTLKDNLLLGIKRRDKESYTEAVQSLLEYGSLCPYPVFCSWLEEAAWDIKNLHRSASGKDMDWNFVDAEQRHIHSQVAEINSRESLFLWFESMYSETEIEIKKVNSHTTSALMEDAVDYIRNNYDDCELNVNVLAEKLNISPAYFGKLFSEFTGCKTLDYITKIRMEKARDLLLSDTEKEVREIARAVGYNNGNYFSSIFKKHFGVSPSKLRDYHVSFKIVSGS